MFNRGVNRMIKEALTFGFFWTVYILLISLLVVKFIAYLNG